MESIGPQLPPLSLDPVNGAKIVRRDSYTLTRLVLSSLNDLSDVGRAACVCHTWMALVRDPLLLSYLQRDKEENDQKIWSHLFRVRYPDSFNALTHTAERVSAQSNDRAFFQVDWKRQCLRHYHALLLLRDGESPRDMATTKLSYINSIQYRYENPEYPFLVVDARGSVRYLSESGQVQEGPAGYADMAVSLGNKLIGDRVFRALTDGSITVISRDLVQSLPYQGGGDAVVFCSTPQHIGIGLSTGKIVLMDTTTLEWVRVLTSKSRSVPRALYLQGRSVYAGFADGQIRVWDIDSGRYVRFSGGKGVIRKLHATDTHLAALSSKGDFVLMELRSDGRSERLYTEKQVSSFKLRGNSVLTGTPTGDVTHLDATTGTFFWRVNEHEMKRKVCCLNIVDNLALIGCQLGIVSIRSLADGAQIYHTKTASLAIRHLKWWDGVLFSGDLCGQVRIRAFRSSDHPSSVKVVACSTLSEMSSASSSSPSPSYISSPKDLGE